MPVAATRTRPPLRILTAVPLCDGHDSAITTINVELARHGIEVIYLGYHQSAAAIARAAVQEDVHAVGLSSYNGGHIVFFREVLRQLRARGGADIPVFGGGGGTITEADARVMQRDGVDRIFSAGTSQDAIVTHIRQHYGRVRRAAKLSGDRALARAITERGTDRVAMSASTGRGFVVGITGPGGAGKSTLIDELTFRFLKVRSARRIAILASDPTNPDSGGAILGDRVSAIYAQDDRVFFRSFGTRGSTSGIARDVPAAVRLLRASDQFDLILVESIGVGQDANPFAIRRRAHSPPPLALATRAARTPRAAPVDAVVFVLAPHYGGRMQLQKISLLSRADLVVLNKCDDPRAAAAETEVAARLGNAGDRRLFKTVAAQHNDAGLEELFAEITFRADLEPAGGERACQLRIED
jgi:methylmalonyl-CoA mutase cobalamin-binding domain/chain